MKAILEFNLPEDAEDYKLANSALHLSTIICELDNFLRSKLKYETLTEEQYKCYEAVREKLYELKNDE